MKIKYYLTLFALCLAAGCSTPAMKTVEPSTTVAVMTVSPAVTVTIQNHPAHNQIWFSSYQNSTSQLLQYSSESCAQKLEDCSNHLENFPVQFSQSVISSISWAPNGEKFALMIEANGSFDIYIANATALTGQNITNSPERESFLSWSPDGTQILYEKDVVLNDGNTEAQIWMAAQDGSNAQKLVAGISAAWSRADKVYYLLQDQISFRNSLYVINPLTLGQGVSVIMTENIQEFSISPDGSTIVMTKLVDDTAILCFVKINDLSNESCPHGISGYSDSLVWSPTGDSIVFTSQADHVSPPDVYLLDVYKMTISNLSNSPGDAEQAPSWSPDGSKVIFASSMDGGRMNIYAVNADGSGLIRLTNATNDSPYFYGVWRP